jgi:hypothetical protein
LSELVARVNDEHKQVKECVIKGAQHAVRAGELLWQAKRKAGHGQWLEWIAENCEFSERTGRFAQVGAATVIDSTATPQYPQASAPFQCDPVPKEEPLGYRIDAMPELEQSSLFLSCSAFLNERAIQGPVQVPLELNFVGEQALSSLI